MFSGVKNSLAAGAPSWTLPAGQLTALPNPLAGLKGRGKENEERVRGNGRVQKT